jgi:DNA-binding NtrC family response regulator
VSEAAPKSIDSAPEIVLIVDDDEAVLEIAEEFLRRAGREPRLASCGREAIDLFQKGSAEIGVVVLDLTMPDIDGREVFQSIRRVRADVPVILATGHAPDRFTANFSDDSRVSFLQKPYDPEQLLEAIRAASGAHET